MGGGGEGVGVEAEDEAVDEVGRALWGWRKWNRLECCMKLPTDLRGPKKFSEGWLDGCDCCCEEDP